MRVPEGASLARALLAVASARRRRGRGRGRGGRSCDVLPRWGRRGPRTRGVLSRRWGVATYRRSGPIEWSHLDVRDFAGRRGRTLSDGGGKIGARERKASLA